MANHDIPRLLSFTDTLADAARREILPYFRSHHVVENKETGLRFDPVTDADRAAERAMRQLIEQEFPEHGILGEEFGETPARSGYQWVIDPIDGTRAFIAGLPSWGVLIALAFEGQPIIGVMDQPYLEERYRGFPGGATVSTRHETRPLRTQARAALSESILSTTDPYLFHGAEADAFARVRQAAKLTRYGYDCTAYALLAAGHIDCVIESGLQPFDIQALIPIIVGAGGGVCTWEGSDAAQGGQVIAHGDARVRDEALALLRGR